MNKLILLITVSTLVLLAACSEQTITGEVVSQPETNIEKNNEVIVQFFWGEGCPFCDRQKPYMDQIKDEYPGIIIESYEVYHDRENQLLFQRTAAEHGATARGVPMTFIGDKYWSGFNERMVPEMKEEIERQLGK